MKRKSGSRRTSKKRDVIEKYFDLAVTMNAFFDNVFLGGEGADAYDKYQKTYKNEVWVYACTYRIANSFAGVPPVLYQKRGKEYVQLDEHPLLDLLEKPNAMHGAFELAEWTSASIELTGTAYWLLDKRDPLTGVPKNIFVLNPKYVQPKKDAKKYISGYTFTVGATQVDLAKEDVIAFLDYNPTDPFNGLGSVAPVRTTIESNIASNVWNRNFFRNSARPEGVLETEKSLGDKQFDRLIKQWKQRYSGEENAHKTALLERGLKYKAIMLSQKDMDFVNLKKMNREDICASFGVPPAIVGIFEYANFANSREQRSMFWEDTMLPKLEKYYGMLNRTLVPLFGDDLFLYYDRGSIEALKKNFKELSEIAKNFFSIGVPLNAIIEKLDLPFDPVKGGDVGYLPMNLYPMTGSAPPKPTPTPPAPKPQEDEEEGGTPSQQVTEEGNDAGKTSKGTIKVKIKHKHETKSKKIRVSVYNTEEKRQRKWDLHCKIISTNETKYKDANVKFFEDQEKQVLANLQKYKSMNIVALTPFLNSVTGTLAEKQNGKEIKAKISIDAIILSAREQIRKRVKMSRPFHNATLLDKARMEYEGLGIPFDQFDVNNPRILAFLDKYGLDNAKNVEEETQKKLRKTLIEGLKEGETISDLAKRIEHEFEIAKGSRSVLIARTETAGASTEGSLEAYKQADVPFKGWLPVYDENTRAGHRQAGSKYDDEGAIPVSEDFEINTVAGGTVSCSAPAHTGIAQEDCNCRCDIYPVQEKEVSE